MTHLCRGLDVGQSGFVGWNDRLTFASERQDLVCLAHIRTAFALSNRTMAARACTAILSMKATGSGVTGPPG
jgi:hypothetical protein